MVSRSTGSWTLPPISRTTTCGFPTVNSKDSRRIISTRIASCSSPRPCTSQVSGRSVGKTRIETFPTSSASSRAFSSRAVRFLPARPASGEVLMPMVIEIDGSSTVISGNGFGSSGSESVSPMVISGIPAMATMSPGPADSAGSRSQRVGDQQLGESDGPDGAVGAAPGDILIASQGPGDDPAEREASEVRRRVQIGDVCLQRRSRDVAGRRDVLQDRGKQRGEICTVGHLAVAGRGQRRATGLG